MHLSKTFVKTRKESPSDEISKNAQLLIKAGFINKEMAGVYSLLPFGLIVLNKIKRIVGEEMEKLGSNEIIMSTLQTKALWEKTNRWSDEKVDIWFKSQLKNGTDVGFGWSHEEPITDMMKAHIGSYKDMPASVYQFQNKLRNETRAKSGIMRCREFIMKDMYSYSIDEVQHMDFYNRVIESYMNIYKKIGLGDITYVTSASGGVFTDKFSHEFQTICDAGEDIIYVHKDGKLAINEEIFDDENLIKIGVKKEDFKAQKAAEVGNIFTFGTGKCEQLDMYFTDKDGTKKGVYLGSYGIGITRLIGVIVEVFSDAKGIIWPESVAPYKYIIIGIGEKGKAKAEEVYKYLVNKGEKVVIDDREESPGYKLKDADLVGYPYQIIISDKTLELGEKMIEFITRSTGEKKIINLDELFKS